MLTTIRNYKFVLEIQIKPLIIDYLVSKDLKKLQYSVLEILQGNALSQTLLENFNLVQTSWMVEH